MSNIQPPFDRVVQTIVLPIIGLLLLCTRSAIGEPYGGGNGVGIHIGGGNYGANEMLKCPRICTCSGQTVDCSHRELTQVPRRIPLDTERL